MKRIIAIMISLTLLLSLCACTNNLKDKPEQQLTETVNETVANNDTEVKEEVPAQVRTDLRIYSDLEPDTLDQDVSVSTSILFRNLYSNLYRINSNNSIVPELAETYTVNEDFTEYTFTIRTDMLFSDGTPITAQDVKFTYERAMAADNDYFIGIESVEAPDDKTVIIKLLEPNNSFLSDMTGEHMAVMSRAAVEGGMDVANCPNITSGAYYVDSWDKENHIIHLKGNPYFNGTGPDITDVTIYYKLEESIYEALRNGTIDYATNIGNDSEDIPYLRVAEGIDLIPYDNCSWNFISLNQLHPQFADDNVRSAIVSALDVNYIISAALSGQGTPAPLMIMPAIAGYLPGFDDSPYDVKKAREYMAASNYPDGFKMKLEIADVSGAAIAEAVKTLLKEIKIDVEIVEEDGNTLVDNALTGNYEAVFLSYSMYSGHVSHAIPLFSNGELHISNGDDTEIGDLLQKSLAVNEKERDRLLSEAYTMMREKWSYIGLYWITVHDAKVEKLKLREPITSERYILSNMYWEQ
ncbi:MAG: ABC transporter substrate-binding protein [Eubacteriales bacterium]|nr:ABC transporter substrate-binding protein [Eubacteriales bacterium]